MLQRSLNNNHKWEPFNTFITSIGVVLREYRGRGRTLLLQNESTEELTEHVLDRTDMLSPMRCGPTGPLSTQRLRKSAEVDPYVTQLRTVLMVWAWHFRLPTYWRHDQLDRIGKRVKKVMERTLQVPDIRYQIGRNVNVWNDFVSLFHAAIPSLEIRSFVSSNVCLEQSTDYSGPSGEQIAKNSVGLLEDLDRLDVTVSIGRNVLISGEPVQNLVHETTFYRQVFKLINVCVRITARGYDGEAGTIQEHQWQKVVNAYKRVLITCLQFLNNLVAGNERLKLTLWLELFNAPSEGNSTGFPTDAAGLAALFPKSNEDSARGDLTKSSISIDKIDSPQTTSGEQRLFWDSENGPSAGRRPKVPLTSFFYFFQDERLKIQKDGATKVPFDVDNITDVWNSMTEVEKEPWRIVYAEARRKYLEELGVWNVQKTLSPVQADHELTRPSEGSRMASGKDSSPGETGFRSWTEKYAMAGNGGQTLSATTLEEDLDESTLRPRHAGEENIASEESRAGASPPLKYPYQPDHSRSGSTFSCIAAKADYCVTTTATSGAQVLQDGKNQLVRRLQTSPREPQASRSGQRLAEPPVVSPSSPVNESMSDGAADEGVEDESGDDDESEDDDDYPIPGDDGRGLLTDIPLILGPNEIEYLPMIIMSSIVPPSAKLDSCHTEPGDENAIINMHTVRCHLLLAQENGRNLLRELLIFVAAWDLRDEELYFKFMVKIMEAILKNGLMPFAYDAFRESKDIISPAQAVLLKLLTSNFRARQTRSVPQLAPSGGATTYTKVQAPKMEYPMRVEVLIVSYLFTEFRQNIVPQTCALIFLQGQIRAGHAHPEDFPLNLWDMERMYEGVYQYLEFFAILTEHDVWKRMMADWEITSELVTLLKELDAAIPKGAVSTPGRPHTMPGSGLVASGQETTGRATVEAVSNSMAVERPYDVPSADPDPMIRSHGEPTPVVEDSPIAAGGAEMQEPTEEPSDFEWRNLKKLAVLVLSSLVWKNKTVQEQVRRYGGLEALVGCCGDDINNLNIKEHAIMCLRLAVEGTVEAEKMVRKWIRNAEDGNNPLYQFTTLADGI